MTVLATKEALRGYIVGQARNNRWSNHRLLKACLHLTPEEYHATRPSFFGSIHKHLDHIVHVDWLYLERLTGRRLLPDNIGDVLHRNLDDLAEDQKAADTTLIEFCEMATDDRLMAQVSFSLINGALYTETVINVLAHLFAHQIHHRGQVHCLLSATSQAPPQLDEFFMAGDLPFRREELKETGLPVE